MSRATVLTMLESFRDRQCHLLGARYSQEIDDGRPTDVAL